MKDHAFVAGPVAGLCAVGIGGGEVCGATIEAHSPMAASPMAVGRRSRQTDNGTAN